MKSIYYICRFNNSIEYNKSDVLYSVKICEMIHFGMSCGERIQSIINIVSKYIYD
jgi:hypothetical protein